MKKILNFINGKWVEPSSQKWMDNFNPATAQVFSQLPDSNAQDVENAATAAQAAFPAWSKLTAQERSQYLYKIADRIEARAQEFAELESRDQGKPVSLALKMDIPRAVLNFRFFAGAILHSMNTSSDLAQDNFNYVLRKPVGVAGLISPWNLPLYLLTWKIAPALAVGNTAVAKPSEFTSMTAALLAEVMQEAGLPAGVMNFIFGNGATAGEALVKHPKVPLISFTGGSVTGKRIYKESAELYKKVSLELGGKNPNLIFADCDFEQAISNTIRSSFLNQGEICLCGSRIYVEESLYNKFVERFVAETKKLKVGDPAAADTFMGPVVSKAHFDKVLSYIELAKKEGGQILAGGKAAQLPAPHDKGWFIEPTIIAGLDQASRCNQEEIFGPVVTIAKFKNLDDAIAKANDTIYGLSASAWTQNLTAAHRLARELHVGTLWINSWLTRDLKTPFGGMKASGIGREGGEHSIEFFTESTSVNVKLL
jgi:aminomuconate-semialdehyde/2-hydroxymuconate-6-semialdehyde dehydrogenase